MPSDTSSKSVGPHRALVQIASPDTFLRFAPRETCVRNCFIYLVIDNFSRRILAWEVATHLSGALHLKTVREAIQRFLPTSESLSDDLTRLITDGRRQRTEENRRAYCPICGPEVTTAVPQEVTQ